MFQKEDSPDEAGYDGQTLLQHNLHLETFSLQFQGILCPSEAQLQLYENKIFHVNLVFRLFFLRFDYYFCRLLLLWD